MGRSVDSIPKRRSANGNGNQHPSWFCEEAERSAVTNMQVTAGMKLKNIVDMITDLLTGFYTVQYLVSAPGYHKR